MALTPRSVFRYFKTDGVPSSGKHQPVKSEIIQLLEMFQGFSGQAVTRNTLSALNGVTPPNENYMGIVLTGSGAGYYYRSGGAWVFGRGFPDSVARLTSVSGVNTITGGLAAGVSPSAVSMFVLTPANNNSGASTLNVAGGGAKPLLNVNGRALRRGELQAGQSVLIYDDGDGNYRIVGSPSASVAVLETVAGSANAVTANTFGVDPQSVVLFSLKPNASNTGAMTISLNGGSARPLRGFDGSPLQAGWVQAGKPVLFYDNGDSTYRLLVDHRFQVLADQAAADAAHAEQQADRSEDDANRSEVARIGSEAARDIADEHADRSGYEADTAEQARLAAEAAASASGNVAFFDDYADAAAAVGGLPEGRIVEVAVDETRDSERTRYRAEGGALVFVTSLSGIPAKAPYVLKSAGVFDVLSYIRNVDKASAEAVQAFDVAGQDGDNVLAAVRAAGDDMMAFVQGGAQRNAAMLLPTGLVGLKDEIFSDNFQEKYWLQASLGKNKRMELSGGGCEATFLQVRSDYISSVRNSMNGNQRSYGPWAGGPSPSFLIPLIASKHVRTPSFFTLRGMTIRGTKLPGVDPVAIGEMNALDSIHQDIHILGIANHGELISGSYNSKWGWVQHENCGVQPVENGVVLGNPAGFPPPWVRFTVTLASNVLTISSVAGSAVRGYTVGAPVPYFKASDVGKEIVVHQGASHGGVAQALKCVVSAFIDAQTITAERVSSAVTISGTILTGQKNLSFKPVKATTQVNSAVATLSAPVKIGRGARDMVGQLVTIPKGGSKSRSNLSLYTSRIVSCDVGNDTDGYTQVTLADQARYAVTDDFVYAAAHFAVSDESTLSANYSWEINDTDFHEVRWEHSAGYNEDYVTSSYQFIAQDISGSTQYSSCKVHGAGPGQGAFCAEGNAIIDNSTGVALTGVDFTFHGMTGKGQLRLMGRQMRLFLTAIGGGAWQLAHDSSLVYADPAPDYDPADFAVLDQGAVIRNKTWPFYEQEVFKKNAALTTAMFARIFANQQQQASSFIRLKGGEDFNDFVFDCDLVADGASGFTNAPPFFSYGRVEVRCNASGSVAVQRVIDANRHRVWERERFSGTFSSWRADGFLPVATTADFASATSAPNTQGKDQGKVWLRSSDGALMVANSAGPTGTWNGHNRDFTVTPS